MFYEKIYNYLKIIMKNQINNSNLMNIRQVNEILWR